MHKDIDFREFARGVATVRNCSSGEVIYLEGDLPECMYIVLSGSVEISSRGKVIETIDEGMALGFLSLMDGKGRTTTARTKEDSQLAIMDRRKFRYMVEEVPNFVWYIMNSLAHRLRTMSAVL
jgi:CRP/FNR family transcriptional regulator, cyclic AMP receptor protein